jgi:hypothetical protein
MGIKPLILTNNFPGTREGPLASSATIRLDFVFSQENFSGNG